jgi:hypothetical protein
MARTATRSDTQVKGKELILGGIVSGYFAGEADGAGKITLKDSSNVAQITIDAGQAGSGNYQIDTSGDVHVGGNLIIDGKEVVYDEVTIESSAIITDNLTAGNAYGDSHKMQGSVLFDVNTANNIIIRDATGGGAALFETQNAASGPFQLLCMVKAGPSNLPVSAPWEESLVTTGVQLPLLFLRAPTYSSPVLG